MPALAGRVETRPFPFGPPGRVDPPAQLDELRFRNALFNGRIASRWRHTLPGDYHGQVDTTDRYTRTAVILHWLIALLILGQIGFGWFLEEIPRGTPARTIYVNVHKSTGMLIGLLIFFRLYWRLRHPAPLFPDSMPAWERSAARASHGLLYACMLIMPLSGYMASNFSKWGVNFFNVLKLPPWGPESEAAYAFLNSTHVLTSYVLVTLILLHVAAALRHLTRRDGIFNRMWPRRVSSEGRARVASPPE
jgi:cytochrome b561